MRGEGEGKDPGATTGSPAAALATPMALRKRVTELARDRERYRLRLGAARKQLSAVRAALERAPRVQAALEALGQKVFDRLLGLLEEKLSVALQEVLEQPIRLKARQEFKRGGAAVEFAIERDGEEEDVLLGQGGSVANVLSVGLRMFALATLDEAKHRRFLVLDEQDCWLRPDLVPRLVKIVRDAGRALGFQVILISHHDLRAFEGHPDRIYRFLPQPDGSVSVSEVEPGPKIADG